MESTAISEINTSIRQCREAREDGVLPSGNTVRGGGGGISLDASYKGGGFGRSAINEGVGVVLITCSARPMKIGGDPKEEWLLPEVKSPHTFLCMILLLSKLLQYRSFIVNLLALVIS